MKHLLFAILVLIFSVNSFACKNVQYVKSGTPAACDGFHVNESQMQEFAKQTDINKLNEQLLRLNETEINYYKKKAVNREEEMNREANRTYFKVVGAFVLGVVLTGIAAKAAIEATK